MPAPKRSGTFFVEVPDLDEGEEVALFSSDAPQAAGPAAATALYVPAAEIVRTRLR